MVDTSMYNALLRPPKSVAEYDAEALQLQQGRQQNKLAMLLMSEKQRASEQAQAKTRVYQGAFDSASGKMDNGKLRAGLGGMGDYEGIQSLDKADAEQAAAQRTAEKERIATAKEQMALIGQVAGAAKDQASYDQGIAQLQQFGVDISKIPPQFDPKYTSQAQQQAMTVAQQLEQLWKQKGFDLEVDKFGETVRNNKATNGISAGQLRVSQANLGLRKTEINQKEREITQKAAGSNKPLPVGALKMRVEAQDAADTADGVNERLSSVEKRISDKKLSFGPVSNALNSGLNMAGVSTEQSRNFASFKSEMEKLRNDSLRLNKGVQTDGDAQRAWNELFQNINDTKLVQQRLTEIKQINARAKNLRLMEVDTIDRNYGRSGGSAPAKAPEGPNIDDLLKKYGG